MFINICEDTTKLFARYYIIRKYIKAFAAIRSIIEHSWIATSLFVAIYYLIAFFLTPKCGHSK